MNPPKDHEQSSWSKAYTDLVEGNVLDLLARQAREFPAFMISIQHLENHRYAPEKWSIKEMLGHIIDTERILAYRALCFSRGDQQSLPSFDENEYVRQTDFSNRTLMDLSDEFETLRKANVFLFKSLSEDRLDKMGEASGHKLSTRTLIYVCAGHVLHHTRIIKERYL